MKIDKSTKKKKNNIRRVFKKLLKQAWKPM